MKDFLRSANSWLALASLSLICGMVLGVYAGDYTETIAWTILTVLNIQLYRAETNAQG